MPKEESKECVRNTAVYPSAQSQIAILHVIKAIKGFAPGTAHFLDVQSRTANLLPQHVLEGSLVNALPMAVFRNV